MYSELLKPLPTVYQFLTQTPHIKIAQKSVPLRFAQNYVRFYR